MQARLHRLWPNCLHGSWRFTNQNGERCKASRSTCARALIRVLNTLTERLGARPSMFGDGLKEEGKFALVPPTIEKLAACAFPQTKVAASESAAPTKRARRRCDTGRELQKIANSGKSGAAGGANGIENGYTILEYGGTL